MKRDKIIIALTIFLTVFGIIMIYSSSSVIAEYRFNNPFKFMIHQSIFAFIGLLLLFFLKKMDYQFLNRHANLILLTFKPCNRKRFSAVLIDSDKFSFLLHFFAAQNAAHCGKFAL